MWYIYRKKCEKKEEIWLYKFWQNWEEEHWSNGETSFEGCFILLSCLIPFYIALIQDNVHTTHWILWRIHLGKTMTELLYKKILTFKIS